MKRKNQKQVLPRQLAELMAEAEMILKAPEQHLYNRALLLELLVAIAHEVQKLSPPTQLVDPQALNEAASQQLWMAQHEK